MAEMEAASAGRFRAAAGLDDAAWALSFALIALPYYRTSNPRLARIARQSIDAVLAEFPLRAGRQKEIEEPVTGLLDCRVGEWECRS